MNAIFLTLALGAQVSNTPLLDVGRDVFALSDRAYMVLPPQSICADVQEMVWSPKGGTLLFRSTDNEPQIAAAIDQIEGRMKPLRLPASKLGFYFPATGKTRWITGLPNDVLPQSIQWTSETTAVVEGSRVDMTANPPGIVRHNLYFLTTAAAKLIAIDASDASLNEYLNIVSDPLSGMTLLISRSDMTDVSGPGFERSAPKVFELTQTGQVLPPSGSIREALSQHYEPQFGLPGKGIVFYSFYTGRSVHRLLTPRMVFEPWLMPKDFDIFESPLPVQLGQSRGLLGDTLYLAPKQKREGDKPEFDPLIICQQVEIAGISPSMTSVAYTSQRMLWVRPLHPISLEVFHKAIEAKRMADAMTRAKQVGTAVMIFAMDNDNRFPTGDPVSALAPYMKNNDIMRNFVFTFPDGKSMVSLADPSATEIGYIPLSGGRVVTYADAHVRWIPDN